MLYLVIIIFVAGIAIEFSRVRGEHADRRDKRRDSVASKYEDTLSELRAELAKAREAIEKVSAQHKELKLSHIEMKARLDKHSEQHVRAAQRKRVVIPPPQEEE